MVKLFKEAKKGHRIGFTDCFETFKNDEVFWLGQSLRAFIGKKGPTLNNIFSSGDDRDTAAVAAAAVVPDVEDLGDKDNNLSLYLLKKRSNTADPYIDNYYTDGMNGIKSKVFLLKH